MKLHRLDSVAVLLVAALASGCSDESRPIFTDVTAEVGIDFVHDSGGSGELHLPEIMGGGVALLDADNDGDLDIYLTGAGVNRLFVRESDGRYADATERSGLGDPGVGLGVAAGDVDNDGDVDVYVANHGPDRLFVNRGDGTFDDASTSSGVDVDGFSCSAVFCDYDRDGWLDLFVTRYVRYDPRQKCSDSSGRRDYCSPLAFPPATDVLLHNEGGGRFVDVTAAAGVDRPAAGLGVVCEDFDGDGMADFYVANDQYANHLWINVGGGRFEDRALTHGAAYNLEGRVEAGMGVVAADIDDDADLDLFVTHLARESNTIYLNLGDGTFDDATGVLGLAQDSLPFTGFGTAAIDVELDGDLDLLVANGRVFRGKPLAGALPAAPWDRFAEPNLLFLQDERRFRNEISRARAFTAPISVSRGLAAGDLDADGDVDVVVTNVESRPMVLRNDAPRSGHWLSIRAHDPRLGRDAIGTRVTVHAGGTSRMRTISRGSSYVSSSEPAAHFGLPAGAAIEGIVVRWPDGLEETFPPVDVDRAVRLVRGKGGAP